MFRNNASAKKAIVFWLLVVLVIVASAFAFVATQPSRVVVPVDTTGAVFRDAGQSIDARVEDLLQRMTVAEKIGQMAMVEKNSIHDRDDIARYGIGAMISGGGGKPEPNTPAGWLAMVNGFQEDALRSRLGIPLLYGADAVHGHSNVPGATVFPHFIGLGATQNPDLVRRVAEATTAELAATGIYWNLSPNLDVAQDARWGRMYESFGSDTALVSALGAAYMEGVSAGGAAIGTAKHFVGAGGMRWGTSSNKEFKIDQGTTDEDEAILRRVHLPPFKAAISAGAASVMVGLNSWNGIKLSANQYLLTDVLKKELGFDGFVVSDWYGVYEIPGGDYRAAVTAINAGVDMVMLPFDYKTFIRNVRVAMERGEISEARIDDAARRILTAKFKAGLFDRSLAGDEGLSVVGSEEHRALAREAVRASQVLLKNTANTLPLSKTASRIVVAGSSAHNIGRQSGGWTVEWQGIDGNWIPGTTILDAIKGAVSSQTEVEYDLEGNFVASKPLADVGVAVVGEAPYAEGWGDSEHPALTPEDLQTIDRVKAASKKIVVIIVSGRPLDIRTHASAWDAVVAAWLPGSEGQGVSDVLFGEYPFTGKLPVAWKL
ncbi:MAG: glycoside hydrolase family 3 N-terminal domain-containing protein [Patescibacteria group bacterium]|jgi:beta-glucosidase